MSNLESFMMAFRLPDSSSFETCECGTPFGDLEADHEDDWRPQINMVLVNGKRYVEDCKCWHELAQKVADWIDCNGFRVLEYLRHEKQRLTDIAMEYPSVHNRSE